MYQDTYSFFETKKFLFIVEVFLELGPAHWFFFNIECDCLMQQQNREVIAEET